MQHGKMLKGKMMRYVCMVIDKSEKGFTFISMFLTITILFSTLPLLVSLLLSTTYSTNYDQISVQHFFHFLRDELIEASSYMVEDNTLKLKVGDRTVLIEKYNTIIRRRVDGQGHEIFLRDVEVISFSSLPYGVHTEIRTLQGAKYEKTIVLYE